MRRPRGATLGALLLALLATPASALSEFGIEGMGVVSTRADEARASVSPDGRRIVWDSDRAGGAGGRDLWGATLVANRWQDPRPLPVNMAGDDTGPMFSADGRWLYFASERPGGRGGSDLYRAAVRADGGFGAAEPLGTAVNTAGDERAPAPSGDGRHLLYASEGAGTDGYDLRIARWDGSAFTAARPVAGVNTGADERDPVWLGGGETLVFVRSARSGRGAPDAPARVLVAHCDGARYAGIAPLALSFNGEAARTLGPGIDWSRPGELLVSGAAPSPRAGRTDVYRLKAPAIAGRAGCVPAGG